MLTTPVRNYQIPFKHPIYPLQTPLRHLPDTHKTPSRQSTDTCQTPSRQFPYTFQTHTRQPPKFRHPGPFQLLEARWWFLPLGKQSQLLLQRNEVELGLQVGVEFDNNNKLFLIDQILNKPSTRGKSVQCVSHHQRRINTCPTNKTYNYRSHHLRTVSTCQPARRNLVLIPKLDENQHVPHHQRNVGLCPTLSG